MRRVFSPMVRVMLGFILLVLYLVPLGQAGTGILDRQVTRAGHPMTLLMPDPRWQMERHADEHTEAAADAALEHPGDPIPGVIVVHGFAGSRQMTSAYGYTLAHAGYAVILLDLPGHGRSLAGYDRSQNVAAIGHALEILRQQPEVDMSRIGLLGHSMGAAAAVEAAVEFPERYRATVAISSPEVAVGAVTPRNLQLQAGAWEADFLQAAQRMSEAAGGANDDFVNGRARSLVVVPRTEHIGIVLRTSSHRAAREWFDQSFDFHVAGGHDHTDWRVLGWILHVFGWLLVASAIAPKYRRTPSAETDLIRRPFQWLGLLGGPVAATAILLLAGDSVPAASLGGIVVGGGLALWFLIAGTLALVVGYRATLPDGDDLLQGVGLFLFLSVAVGLTGHLVWSNWVLTPARMLRWPLFALACMPWFVAMELGQGDPRQGSRWAWFLAQTVAVIAGLALLARTVPGMGVVSLILPLLPLYFGLFVFMGTRVRRPWALGIGCGLFFGWVLAVAFPSLG